MAYKIASKEIPVSLSGNDIKVIVRITGLSMNGSEYEDYKVINWREKINCFIDWEYDSEGNFNSIKYNEPNVKKAFGCPIVTHWDYLKKVSEKMIDKAEN